MKYPHRLDPAKLAARLERNAAQLITILQGQEDVSREEIIRRLGVKSLSGFKVRLATARKMGHVIHCENNGGQGENLRTWYRMVTE
jgi:hypothetical protein